MAGGIWHEWAEEKCKQDFGGEPEGMRLLGRLRCRWVDSVKMDVMNRMGCVNRINLALDRCTLQEYACKHCVQLSLLFQVDHTI
jgi:hypothetical protein